MNQEHFVSDSALERLSMAIQIKTVSHAIYDDADFGEFDKYLAYLKSAFPVFFFTCTFEQINSYGLLFRWQGKNPDKLPILLMAHYDVVPAQDEGWQYPPFSGMIAEGKIWGRGTLDIKSQQIAHMEAAEALMKEGFVPEGDIYFAYGQDEEVGGAEGAAKIAVLLKERGIRLAGVLDEGGLVISGAIKGVHSPVALIGVAEKGRCDYEITAAGGGGHASMPPKTTAIGQISEMVRRIEQNPLPARLTVPVLEMFKAASAEMGFLVKLAAHNAWLFGGLLKSILAKAPETNSMIRTTFAATIAKSGQAANVLPLDAMVNINVRLLNGDTADSVEAYFKRLAADIPVAIKKLPSYTEASPESPMSGAFYEAIKENTKTFFPEAIVTPFLVMGGTDSRHFAAICDHIYRFTPIYVTNEEKNTVHNRNENLSIENYAKMISFYGSFMKMF